MKPSPKPVRECHDCGLNLGDRCAIYPVPRMMWHHRECPGYKNEEMLRQYQAELARHPIDPRKQKRREIAKLRATAPHLVGNTPRIA
ncbi:MAG: hypothetical protein N2255_04265 [Kiritimatiellae bacterium]|nr:hypothetical protein [Kiritimatiellia bacterium]